MQIEFRSLVIGMAIATFFCAIIFIAYEFQASNNYLFKSDFYCSEYKNPDLNNMQCKYYGVRYIKLNNPIFGG